MSRETSIENGQAALLESGGQSFKLKCACGWKTDETRLYVLARINRHFAALDAQSWETVTVAPAAKEEPR